MVYVCVCVCVRVRARVCARVHVCVCVLALRVYCVYQFACAVLVYILPCVVLYAHIVCVVCLHMGGYRYNYYQLKTIFRPMWCLLLQHVVSLQGPQLRSGTINDRLFLDCHVSVCMECYFCSFGAVFAKRKNCRHISRWSPSVCMGVAPHTVFGEVSLDGLK